MTPNALPTVEHTKVHTLLHQLGVLPKYKGFYHTSFACCLCMQQPERLQLVTKQIYPEVAKHFDTNWHCVERNIRTVSSLAWHKNRTLLEDMARCELLKRPTASAFLAILTTQLWV